jgi:hypothetical protein
MTRRAVLGDNPKNLEKFDRALSTGRTHVVPIWRRHGGVRIAVRALGHLQPQQFSKMVAPTDYVNDWEYLTHEENSPVFDINPQLRDVRNAFVGNVEYSVDDLIDSVRQRGVHTPVIVHKVQKDEPVVDLETNDWKRDSEGKFVTALKYPLIDGHHRAYAAMKANRSIPVWITAEELIRQR